MVRRIDIAPEWCRSKCNPEGVMIPYVSCSGVRDEPVAGVLLSGGGVARADFSCGERLPSFDSGAPSMEGVSCLALLQAVRAAKPAPRESTFRRLGSIFFMVFRISRRLRQNG